MWPTDDELRYDVPTDPTRQWSGQGNWWDTPTGDTYLRDNPNVAYNWWNRRLGIDMSGNDPRTRWMRSYYDQDHLNYLSALAVNPTLSYHRDWLPSQANSMQSWANRWQALTPNQRNERPMSQPIRYIPW